MIAGAGLWANRAFYHDDAFIMLRYARNLLQGKGSVWNPGERVEGYTSFLHLMLTAAAGALGVDLLTAARLVSALAFGLLVWVVLAAGAREASGAWRWLPAAATATAWPLLIWIEGGLETALFSLLITAGLALTLRAAESPGRAAAAGLHFALAALTRPEGLLFAAVAGLWLAVEGRKQRRGAPVMAFGSALLVLLLPHELWRLSYYGDPLPNTWYVKGTGGGWDRIKHGLAYAGGFAAAPPFLVPGILAAAAASRLRGAAFDRRVVLLLLATGGFAGYVVLVGGDHMTAYRFLAPLIPALALLLALVASPASGALPGGRLALTVLLAAAALQGFPHALNPRKADPAAYKGRLVGLYIASHWPAGSLVALNTAGTTPYFAPEMRCIDMLGLNDRTIAHRESPPVKAEWQRVPGHAKGDGAYVLSRRPDFIIVGPAEGATIDAPWFLSDHEMRERRAEFDRDYTLETASIDVSAEPAHAQYEATAGGALLFRYYRRKAAH